MYRNHEGCLSDIILSSFESLGLPILEACNCRKSILIPNLQYAKELLGNTGYYLKYPLDEDNFLTVLSKFKNELIKNKNYPAELNTNTLSSKELLNIFLNKLKVLGKTFIKLNGL